jgi:hypothetical protein
LEDKGNRIINYDHFLVDMNGNTIISPPGLRDAIAKEFPVSRNRDYAIEPERETAVVAHYAKNGYPRNHEFSLLRCVITAFELRGDRLHISYNGNYKERERLFDQVIIGDYIADFDYSGTTEFILIRNLLIITGNIQD